MNVIIKTILILNNCFLSDKFKCLLKTCDNKYDLSDNPNCSEGVRNG